MCILQQIQVYQSATIVLLVLSILVIIITFFGCCGAYKENRCLLATVSTYMTIRSFAKVVFMIIHQKWRFIFFLQYFGFDVLLLIGAGIGAYFVFTGNLDALKTPFIEALKEYDDLSQKAPDKTLVTAWDSFQTDVRFFFKYFPNLRKKFKWVFFSSNVAALIIGMIGPSTILFFKLRLQFLILRIQKLTPDPTSTRILNP